MEVKSKIVPTETRGLSQRERVRLFHRLANCIQKEEERLSSNIYRFWLKRRSQTWGGRAWSSTLSTIAIISYSKVTEDTIS